MKKPNPLSARYDPTLISHNRGKTQGQVYYSVSVQKDSDTMHLDIENPAMATTVRLSLNQEDANTLKYILGEAVEALKTGKGNESPRQENT